MTTLTVTRLLQNPLGHPAADGTPGDIVKVTNGAATIYLTPAEFASLGEDTLRWRLSAQPDRRHTPRGWVPAAQPGVAAGR